MVQSMPDVADVAALLEQAETVITEPIMLYSQNHESHRESCLFELHMGSYLTGCGMNPAVSLAFSKST